MKKSTQTKKSGQQIAREFKKVITFLYGNIKVIYSLTAGGVGLYYLIDYINRGQPIETFDNLTIFLAGLTTIFLLYPLWSEIQIGNFFTLKRNVEELKKSVDDKFSAIQTSLIVMSQAAIAESKSDAKAENYNFFGGNYDPQVMSELANAVSSRRNKKEVSKSSFDVPESAKKAFELRYALETRIRRLAELKDIDTSRAPMSRLASLFLNENEHALFRQIYVLTSEGIHGKSVSEKEILAAIQPTKELIGILDERINGFRNVPSYK